MQDEAELRSIKRVAVHPVSVYVKDFEMEPLYQMHRDTLAKRTVKPATRDFREELIKQLPVIVISPESLNLFVSIPIPADSTGWLPEWKSDKSKLPFDAVAFLEIILTTSEYMDNVYATCTIYSISEVQPVACTQFDTKKRKMALIGAYFIGAYEISKSIPDAIAGVVKKMATAWEVPSGK